MSSYTYRAGRVLAVAALIVASCLGAAITLLAQDQDQPSRREARGRLPNHYTQVVDGAQREEIYSIQKKYESEVDKLRRQLEELIDKRDAEIRDVLSPEQQKQVDELQEEARKRRRENRRNRRASEEESVEAEAAAKESSLR